MSGEISHIGRVVDITPEMTTVEIISESACSSCHASALCGLGDIQKKAVQLPTSPTDFFEVGEEVYVNLKATMGHKAVWLAYALPLVVLLASVFIALGSGLPELLAGAAGIGSVIVYYGVIFLFRERLRNEYVFYLKRKQ